MNTAKVYQDMDGNDCTIHQMVERDPHWAASRIQVGEDAIEKIAALESQLAEKDKELSKLKQERDEYVGVLAYYGNSRDIYHDKRNGEYALNTLEKYMSALKSEPDEVKR